MAGLEHLFSQNLKVIFLLRGKTEVGFSTKDLLKCVGKNVLPFSLSWHIVSSNTKSFICRCPRAVFKVESSVNSANLLATSSVID